MDIACWIKAHCPCCLNPCFWWLTSLTFTFLWAISIWHFFLVKSPCWLVKSCLLRSVIEHFIYLACFQSCYFLGNPEIPKFPGAKPHFPRRNSDLFSPHLASSQAVRAVYEHLASQDLEQLRGLVTNSLLQAWLHQGWWLGDGSPWSPWWIMVAWFVVLNKDCHWIGLRDNLQAHPIYLMVQSHSFPMVSYRVSRKNESISFHWEF